MGGWCRGVVTSLKPLQVQTDGSSRSFSWIQLRPCSDTRTSAGGYPNLPVDSTSSSTCVVCLINPPTFVCENGHLVLCRTCRRKIVFQRLQKLGEAPKSEQELQAKSLNRTVVACPVCRTESCLTPATKYNDQIYLQTDA